MNVTFPKQFVLGRRGRIVSILTALALFSSVRANAETTNTLSAAEMEGRDLVRQLLEQRPSTNFSTTGVLKFKDATGKRLEIPLVFDTVVSDTNWTSRYEAGTNWVTVTHAQGSANEYRCHDEFGAVIFLSGNETMVPFAGSDFWLADLGLEFFHWPQQKVLKKEVRSSRGCAVLESLNPNPATNAYARVLSWIDSEGGAIIQAKAYDVNGKLLKEFYPKNIKKVNGQYQLESMEMDNPQTDSRTWLKFDLKSN